MRLRRRIANALLRNYTVARPFLPRGYHAYPGPGGRIYLDLRESPTMWARLLRGYEPGKVRALQLAIGPGKVFVDVGGNKGDFSLVAAKTAHDDARILCVEPEPENAGWIRRSVERNGYRSVEVIEAALAESDGEATLHLGEKSGWHSLVDDPAATSVGEVVVPIRSLDALVAERGIDQVDVIKIDVEGAEDRVLAGGQRTFGSDNAMTVLLDLHPPRVDAAAICSQLEAWGFDLRHPDDPSAPLPPGDRDRVTEVIAVRA